MDIENVCYLVVSFNINKITVLLKLKPLEHRENKDSFSQVLRPSCQIKYGNILIPLQNNLV